MSRTRDFNLLKAGEVNATSSNTNTVSVVVNADTQSGAHQDSTQKLNFTPTPMPALGDPQQVMYPGETQGAVPSLLPQEANVELPQGFQNELDFYKLLASILSDVLKDNNPKLIVNVIDTSGKIIIKGEDLIRLIAIKTNVDVKDVNLRYCDEEPGCMSKLSPIKIIEDIKIKNESFSLRYNAEYNILKDDFNISLRKVIIT